MLSTISGMLLGAFKNLVWVGYAAVEALLFMWVFNYLAPIFPTWGWNFLPVVHIGYWTSLCIFLLIGFLGNWIQSLVPSIVSIQKNKNK